MPSRQVKDWVRSNDYFTSLGGGSRTEQGGDVFVPSENRYPHIHISNNFVVLSKSSGNHIDLIRGGQVYGGRCRDAVDYCSGRDADMWQVCRYIVSQLV